MNVLYAGEDFPQELSQSIFLAGPTPRQKNVPSWRSFALHILEEMKYDGFVFVPEPEDGNWRANYDDQIMWERRGLEQSDVVLFWIPRDLKQMPAFTTNCEFGRYIETGRVIYGRPNQAPKNRYLDLIYQLDASRVPFETLEDTIKNSLDFISPGAVRRGGETRVPLIVWRNASFQKWYASQIQAGNRLEDCKVLWSFKTRQHHLYAFAVWAKIWVQSESRYKENEIFLSRSDISTIAAFCRHDNILDTEILLVREFRVSVRNDTGFVHELPGGSSHDETTDPCTVAASELKEECGLIVDPSRLRVLSQRQLAATFSTHKAQLFSVMLTKSELDYAKKNVDKTFGVIEDSELTHVEVSTLRDLLDKQHVDWSMLGMIYEAISKS